MTRLPLSDRNAAGRELAAALSGLAGRGDVLVLGLPRGGVPVAAEVARGLGAPLDVMIVRKLGTPGQEELAMGAVASGGVRVLNADVIRHLHISDDDVEAEARRELQEVERREHLYRAGRPPLAPAGKSVVLVDDGLATGATMEAAIRAVRQLEPAQVIVAVPVAPPDTILRMRELADEVVCLATPERFFGIGQWYEDFHQVSDDEVREQLRAAPLEPDPGKGG